MQGTQGQHPGMGSQGVGMGGGNLQTQQYSPDDDLMDVSQPGGAGQRRAKWDADRM